MKAKNIIRLHMQYFAEDTSPSEDEPPVDTQTEPAPPNYEELAKTDTALQGFLNGKIQAATQAELEKQRILADEKVSEAEKLAKMNKEEKQAYELKKAQEEIARYKLQDSVRGLKEEALKTASEKGIPASLIELIPFASIKAEEVSPHIDSLKTTYDNAVKEGIAQALDGAGTPKGTGGAGRTFTKEELGKMSPSEINQNWDSIQKSL